MEILNNIWTSFTSENEIFINIMSVLFLFIELPLTMNIFLAVLNIPADRKQKLFYLLGTILLGIICVFFIPKPYSNIVTLISAPILIMYVFKVRFFKAVVAEFVPVLLITLLESLSIRLALVLFDVDYSTCASIPLAKLLVTGSIYIMLFLIYKLIKQFNIYITLLDRITRKNRRLLLMDVFLALVIMFMQMYIIVFYYNKLPSFITLVNFLFLIAYFSISMHNIIDMMRLEKTNEDLEQQKMYNKTLQILHDNIRGFKHDFANIISGIGGYVETNDMEGLKKYYKQLLKDCTQVSNLSSLNPESINNPAVYSILANKYYKADNLGITINLESFIDFNNLNMEIYEFSRILGILMDNAIEASSECENKHINVVIRNDFRQHRQLLIIENTYKNKDVDLEKIYEKGYSTKTNNTGLGLWEVNNIVKRRKNLARYTTKSEDLFKQQLEIYEK